MLSITFVKVNFIVHILSPWSLPEKDIWEGVIAWALSLKYEQKRSLKALAMASGSDSLDPSQPFITEGDTSDFRHF